MDLFSDEKLVQYIYRRYSRFKLVKRDSILIFKNNSIIKIPRKKTLEELTILKLLRELNIPTIKILDSDVLKTRYGDVPYYVMEKIQNCREQINLSKRHYTGNYYDFLFFYFETLTKMSHKLPLKGFGESFLVDKTLVGKYQTIADCWLSLLDKVEKRNYWEPNIINNTRTKISKLNMSKKPILVHNDLLKNILYSGKSNQYVIIDPQTSLSLANKYWDLASYILYSHGYGKNYGLSKFIEKCNIDDPEEFGTTLQVVSLERISYFHRYNPEVEREMLKYWQLNNKL
jgi:hypothetical protein